MTIHAIDKKGQTLVLATHLGEVRHLTPAEFLRLEFAQPGDFVVGEHSHLTAKRFSQSQIFFPAQIEQLLATATTRGVSLRVVAEAVTPRKLWEYREACEASGHPVPADTKTWDKWEDKDEAVAVALASHAAAVGPETLCRLRLFNGTYDDPMQAWAQAQREDINLTWEILRNLACWDPDAMLGYASGVPADDALVAGVRLSYLRMLGWLEGRAWETTLRDPGTFREVFLGGKNPTPAVLRDARKRVAVLWFCLANGNGERRTYKGRPVGVNSVMRHLLKMKEFHRKAGSHRAQLYWHSLRGMVRRAQGATSPKSYALWDAFDHEIHTEQKRRLRAVVKDVLQDMARHIDAT